MIVTVWSAERWIHMSHGTRILCPLKEVKLPWNKCHIRPIGAVQTFKETHTNAPNKSTPARNSREIRPLRDPFSDFRVSLMASTWAYRHRVLGEAEGVARC